MTYRLKKFLLAMLAVLIAAPVSAQMSSFDQSKNLMTLQLVKAGGQYFSKMALFLPVPPDLWQLQSKGVPVNPLKASDAALYSETDGSLKVPVLKIDSTVYANVKLNLPASGSWSLLDLGDVMSTTSPGYELSYPITGKMPNIYCTDSGGELSYLINVTGSSKPQVWKHVADEPCCPLAVTTSSPANIAGISDVQLYPNPGEGGSTGNFRMMVSYTGKVSGGSTTPTCEKNVLTTVYPGGCLFSAAGTCIADTPPTAASTACSKNVLPAVYPGNCVFSAGGTICIADTPPVAGSTACVKNVPDATYAGTCSSPTYGACIADTPTAATCTKNVANSVYAGNCIMPTAGTCVAETPESCIVNVPASVYSGGCFSAGPGLCNPTIGATDYYSCLKNVPDSVYSGACFSPEKGICNATTGSADNGFCTGATIKRSEFCSLIDNSGYCSFTAGNDNSKYCTPVNTPPITYDQYCSLVNTPAKTYDQYCSITTSTAVLVDQTGVETCVVRPVLDVLNYPIGSNLAALAVSETVLKMTVSEKHTVYVSGGLPPYFVTASRPGVLAYELLAGDATGIGQALVITAKAAGTTQLSVFDYNGSVLPLAITSASIPLLVSPSTIDVPEGTLIDVRIEGGVPPLTVYNPTPDWVDAPATVASTPTTLRIAMKKSSGSSKTFLTFTDAAGTQASITEIKIAASTTGITILPVAITLKVGEYYDLYVTGGNVPITIRNPNTSLMDIPVSLAATPGNVRVLAKASTGGAALPIVFTDKYGLSSTVNVTIANIPLLVSPSSIDVPEGTLIDVRIEGGVPPLTVFNPTPDWVEAPTSIPSTPTTIRIAMKKSSGSSTTFLTFTDTAGSPASIGPIKISASTTGTTILPSSITLKVGEYYDLYVTGGNAPISIRNPNTTLMDVPASLATTPGTVRVLAKKSTSGVAVPIYFTDRYGIVNTVNVTVSPSDLVVQPLSISLKVGEYYDLYVTGGVAPITIINPNTTLMDVPGSLDKTPGTVRVTAKKGTGGDVPIYFTDALGTTQSVNVTIAASTPILK
jgi:hypothetical protein